MIARFLLFTLLCTTNLTFAQSLEDFNLRKQKISKNGMVTLGSWALINIGTGAGGWAISNSKEWQSFHQMNLVWGAVNLGIAIPSYLGARKENPADYDAGSTYRNQLKKEKVFLANTAFDMVYVTGGFIMRERAKWDVKNRDLLNGWGNSFIVQGSFLFAFDFAMTLIHNRHRKKHLDPIINVSVGPYGPGIRWTI